MKVDDTENKEGAALDGWDYMEDFDYENDAGLPEDRTVFDDDNSEDFDEVDDWEEKAEEVGAPATSQDSVDIGKHLERYHPDGMKKGGKCKYHDEIKDAELRKQIDKIPYDLAAKRLWEDFGIEVLRAKGKDDFAEVDFAPVDTLEFFKDGKALESDEAQEYAAKVLWSVCYDLRKRFPTFDIANPIFVPWDFSNIRGIGRSSNDRRIPRIFMEACAREGITDSRHTRRECYLSLGDLRDLEGETPNYAEGKGVLQAMVIARHEIGHNLATKEALDMFKDFKGEMFGERDVDVSKDEVARAYFQNVISEGAESNEECMAELFSRYTSPSYKKGSMPEKIENIAKFMLSQYQGKNMDEINNFTIDEKNDGKVEGLPFSERMLRAFGYDSSIYPMGVEMPKEGEIAWWDQHVGEYVKFEDYDKMLRYVLDAYAFEPEHIELISAATKGRVWTPMRLWDMRSEYHWTDESAKAIAEKYRVAEKKGEEDKGNGSAATAEDGMTMDEIADGYEAKYKAEHDGVMHSYAEIAAEDELDRRYGKEGIAQDSKDLEDEVNLGMAKRRLEDLAEEYLEPLKGLKYSKDFGNYEIGETTYGKKRYAWIKHLGLDAGSEAYLVLRYIGATPYVAISEDKGIGYYNGHQAGAKYLPEGFDLDNGGLPGHCDGEVSKEGGEKDIKCEKCSELDLDDAFAVYVAVIKSEKDKNGGDDGDGTRKKKKEDDGEGEGEGVDLGEVFMKAYLGEDRDGSVTQDVDISKHIKRYHPNGMSEHSSCKYYIGNRQGENDVRKDYYEQIDAENAEDGLAKEFGIHAHLTEDDELDFLGLPSDLVARMRRGRAMTTAEYAKACEMVFRVCKDIKSRFNAFRPGVDFLFGWVFGGQEAGGRGSLDRRQSHGYMFLEPSEEMEGTISYHYYHPDARRAYDVIRHELGHSMSSIEVKNRFTELFDEKAKELGVEKIAEMLKSKVSIGSAFFLVVGKEQQDREKEEAIAELFSVYTSPWYKKGDLPSWMEEFVEYMIKGESMPTQHEMIAEDEMASEEKMPEQPRLMRGYIYVETPPLPDDGKPFPFFDDMKWKWVYFDTAEEREARKKELDEIASHETPEMIKAWSDYCVKKMMERVRERKTRKQKEKGSEDAGEAFLKAYLGEDYAEGNVGRGVTLDKGGRINVAKKRPRFKEGDSVQVRKDIAHGEEIGEVRKVDEGKGVYFIEFDETGVWDECEIGWVDATGRRLDMEGYWVDEDGETRLDDYSIGRWVTFPCVKMNGKVRQIVGEERVKNPETHMEEWKYICENPDDNKLLKRILVDLQREHRRAYETRKEAEEGLKKEESEQNKKVEEYMREKEAYAQDSAIVNAILKDDAELGKEDIYDPEQFDMNSYEWGAIYHINDIREKVKGLKGDGVSLKQLQEMLSPMREAALGYAKDYTSPGKPIKKWVQVLVLDVPDTIEKAFKVIAKGEEGSGEEGNEMGKDYFLKCFTCEAIGFINDGRLEGDDKIEVRAKEVDDYYNRSGRYDGGTTGFKVGQYAYVPKSKAKTTDGLPYCMRIVAFTRDGEEVGVDGAYLQTGGLHAIRSALRKYKIGDIAKAFDSQDEAHKWLDENVGKELNHLAAEEIEKAFGVEN